MSLFSFSSLTFSYSGSRQLCFHNAAVSSGVVVPPPFALFRKTSLPAHSYSRGNCVTGKNTPARDAPLSDNRNPDDIVLRRILGERHREQPWFQGRPRDSRKDRGVVPSAFRRDRCASGRPPLPNRFSSAAPRLNGIYIYARRDDDTTTTYVCVCVCSRTYAPRLLWPRYARTRRQRRSCKSITRVIRHLGMAISIMYRLCGPEGVRRR